MPYSSDEEMSDAPEITVESPPSAEVDTQQAGLDVHALTEDMNLLVPTALARAGYAASQFSATSNTAGLVSRRTILKPGNRYYLNQGKNLTSNRRVFLYLAKASTDSTGRKRTILEADGELDPDLDPEAMGLTEVLPRDLLDTTTQGSDPVDDAERRDVVQESANYAEQG